MKKQVLNCFNQGTKILLAFLILSGISTAAFSQHPQGQAKKIGTVKEFEEKIRPTLSNARRSQEKSIETSDGPVSAIINVNKKEKDGEIFIGEVKGSKTSSVSFTLNGSNFDGQVVMPQEKMAYEYFTEPDGNVYVQEVDIHDVLCVDYENLDHADAAGENQVLAVPPSTSTVYKLQSLPGATAVAYLDFDGEVVSGTRWDGGNTINAVPGNFTEAGITAIWNMISEDFRPFNINITTDRAVFDAAPGNRRINCIFTPTNTASPGAGGVAYLNSFTDSRPNEPCWVFNGGVKSAGEAGTHEIGHTMGLSHDATSSASYYGGHGIWGPIMGASYSRGLVQWSIGEYPNANQFQDDINIIVTRNGFTYRTDEAGNTIAAAKALVIGAGGAVVADDNYGIITQRTDIDVYSFTIPAGTVTFTANPAPAYPDLDILLRLTDASGTIIATANPTATQSGTGATAVSGLNASLTQALAAGTYYLHVDGTGQGDLTTGYSDYGSLGEYRISGTVPSGGGGNVAPTVSITAPANNTTYTAPASITLTASASDVDGTVSSVAFYSGSTLLGSDATSPYSFTWTNVAAGTYTITARATDNAGAVGTSTAITIVVNPACVPSAITPYTRINAGAWIQTSTAGLNVGDQVIFGPQPGTGGSWSWSGPNGFTALTREITLTNIQTNQAGNYVATYTNTGGCTSTQTFTVTVNTAPTVSITSPANNATFIAPATITINATATDANGSVTKVEFFNGTTKLGEDLTSPYSFTWNSVAAGTYSLTAVATDNLGLTKTSTAVSITVNANQAPTVSITSPLNNATFIAPASITITASASDLDGSVTKVEFFNGAAKLGEDLTSPYSFTWNSVAAGTYSITAVATDNLGLTKTSTAVSITVNSNQAPTVSITSPLNNATFIAPANISITANASDADGSVTKVEFFNGAAKLGEDLTSPYSFAWNSVAAGTYSITAVVTDNLGLTKTSTAVSITVNNNQAPIISITSPLNNATFIAPASITITANASDADGSVTKVEFFNGPTKLGEDLISPYSYTWSPVVAGSYTLSAKATDNLGQSTTVSVSITVEHPNHAPLVEIVSPFDNSIHNGPATITIDALASDDDGTVTKVEFFNGSTKLGEDATAPYSFVWSSIAAGTYDIIVKATDDDGVVSSAVHTIEVTTVSALSNPTILTEIPIHPNPTTGIFNIDLQKVKPKAIKIVDSKGAEVKTIHDPGNIIDISDLNSGMYILILMEEKELKTVRLIKH